MLGDIDLNAKPPVPEVFLCKPDRTIIGKLNGRMGLGFSRFGKRNHFIKHTSLMKLGNINTMEFGLPYEIEKGHQLIRNPIIDLIKVRYYLKVLFMNTEEWFVVTDISDAMDGQMDVKTVSCKSCAYELADRVIYNFDVVSVNLHDLLMGGNTLDKNGNSITFSGLLNSSLWTISPDSDTTFNLLYRSFNFSNTTVLDAIFQACATYAAVPVFNTVNRQISFQQLVNIGQDKGFKITYQNYMKSVDFQSKTDDMVTEFEPVGASGLNINSVNPTGLTFLSDYSTYLYPFQRDTNGNVIKSSDYMSNSLAGAILDFNAKVAANQTTYSNLLSQLTGYQTTLTSQQNDLVSLNTTLQSIQASLDIAQTTGQDTSSLLSQQASQQSLISAKQSDINATNANITSVNSQISTLQQTLSESVNFTTAQLDELQLFRKRKIWSNSSISDAQALYDAAQTEFAKYKDVSVILNVDLVDLMALVTEQRNWDKLSLGDVIGVEYENIGVNVKTKIVEISTDHNEQNITLTLANTDDLLRDEEKILKMLYQGQAASASIGVNSSEWNKVTGLDNTVNDWYLNGINSAKQKVTAGVNDTVTINSRGITVTDTNSNGANLIRITNGVIAISSNSGTDFQTAISAQGVFAQQLVGQVVASSNLTIGNTGGTFQVTANGVVISGLALTITGGLGDGNIASSQNWNTTATNFNTRNDRISIVPANPTLATDGTCIDHTISTDGSANISFEWQYNGTGDAYNIDGFIVYMYQSTSGSAYTFGTSPASEKVDYITPDKRAFIIYGVPANQYYTFGIQAYRIVDQDVNSSGILKSSIIQSTYTGTGGNENPYLPTSTVAFNGDITGTIAGTSAATVVNQALNSLQLGNVYNGVVINSTNGIVVTTSNVMTQTVLNATTGIQINKNTGSVGSPVWSPVFFADTSGNLTVNGIIKAADLQLNGVSILSNGATKISGTYIDSITTGQLVVTSQLGDNAIASATNWNNKTTLITSSGVYTGSVYANQIVVGGGTISDSLLASASNWNGKTTLINSSGVYTGSVYANQIVVGGGTIPDSLLTSASNWNGKTTLLTGSGIYTGTLTADKIITTDFTALNSINIGTYSTNNTQRTLGFNNSVVFSTIADSLGIQSILQLDARQLQFQGGTIIDFNNTTVNNLAIKLI